MPEDISFELEDKTFQKLKEKKQEMGFENSSWDEWFKSVFEVEPEKVDKKIIEDIFQKNNLEKYYDDWIRNFGDNLPFMKNDSSLHEIIPRNIDSIPKSSIVIGRGPSLKEKKHLEILSESNFSGNIICTDGVLPTALKAGITPDKFENFYVVTIDVQEHQKKFYQDELVKKYGNKIKCILSSTVPLSTYQSIKENNIKIFWFHALVDYDRNKTSFNHIIGTMSKSQINPKGFPSLQTGGNVGTSSWIIGWAILKSQNVCLIGLDQGYSIDTPLEKLEHYNIPESINKESDSFKKAFPSAN